MNLPFLVTRVRPSATSTPSLFLSLACRVILGMPLSPMETYRKPSIPMRMPLGTWSLKPPGGALLGPQSVNRSSRLAALPSASSVNTEM